jgi:hypothetical protein
LLGLIAEIAEMDHYMGSIFGIQLDCLLIRLIVTKLEWSNLTNIHNTTFMVIIGWVLNDAQTFPNLLHAMFTDVRY